MMVFFATHFLKQLLQKDRIFLKFNGQTFLKLFKGF